MVLWSESRVLRVSRVNLSFFFLLLIDFFFYFHPSTLIWLRIELFIFFYFLFMKLTRVWQVHPGWSRLFFVLFFNFNLILQNWLTWVFFFFQFLVETFQFHLSIFGWLEIILHNLFWFELYEVISVLWPESRVCSVDSRGFCFLFFIIIDFV